MRALEATPVALAEQLVQDVRLWRPRWQLRNAVFEALHTDLESRRPGKIYIWGDMLVHLFIFECAAWANGRWGVALAASLG